MATIAALTENFTGAAAGQNVTTGNSIFDSISGTGGTSVYNADTYIDGQPSMQVDATTTFRSHNKVHTAAGGWRGFGYKPLATPGGADTIFAWYTTGGTAHCGDVRVLTDRTVQLRNAASSSVYVSTGLTLTLNTWYWFSVQTTNANVRLKVYNSGGLFIDSSQWTTGFSAGTPDQIRLGTQQSTAVVTSARFARFRGDDSTEIASGLGSPPGNVVYSQSTQTLIDASASTGTLGLTQISGPTATSITGPSAGVYTVVHPASLSADMVFELTATQSSVTDTETVTIVGGGASKIIKVFDGSSWI